MSNRVPTRRDDILAVTLAQIAERGITALRIQDVAQALGISTALVHYHFESRALLLAAAFENYALEDLRRMDQILAHAESATERLARLLREYGPVSDSASAGWITWIDAWALAQHEPSLRAAMRRIDARWQHAVAQLIEGGNAEGAWSCPDPEVTARRLLSLTEGLAVAHLLYRTVTGTQLRNLVAVAGARELGIEPEAFGYPITE